MKKDCEKMEKHSKVDFVTVHNEEKQKIERRDKD